MRKLAAWLVLFGVLAAPMGPIVTNGPTRSLGAEPSGRRDSDVDLDPEVVRQAINGAINYLKRQQKGNGTFGLTTGQYPGGITALCTLALLNAGVAPEDPSVARALGYLRKVEPKMTYAVALQTMVFAQAGQPRDQAAIIRNVHWLENAQIQQGDHTGSWGYLRGAASGDNSNAQFALLALHEAERAGIEVRPRTWQLAKDYWEKAQKPDGSWGYKPSMPGTGSMTCAGLASLAIASDKVRASDAVVVGEEIRCCQQADSDNDRIERGLQWLGKNFTVAHNPHDPGRFLLYYLYGVERVGRLTARRFIGGHDWYREGTRQLIEHHRRALSGGFVGASTGVESREEIATAFALLFLAKGRRPILLAKLNSGSDKDWNEHESDVDNLTRYVEKKWKQDLTWQTVDLRAADVDDLLQSPVLYLVGSKSPLPGSPSGREDVAQKLRGYLDRGGFLLAEGYAGGTEFDQGFRQLMKDVFPEPEYALNLLPPVHPIWRTEETVDPERMRSIEGIDFGCRTSVIYCPPDTSGKPRPSLSCLWELARPGRDQQYGQNARAEIAAALSIGINVLAYATNRELVPKYEVPRVLSGAFSSDDFPRGTIYVANLRHPGGCNAAPRALGNLLEAAAREMNLPTSSEQRTINITDPALFDHHMVFMHGRNTFQLTPAEREQLRTYVERGGMVFANAICASRPFEKSFRREMGLLFPDNPLEAVPNTDSLLTDAYGGFDLARVKRLDPQQRRGDGPMKVVPRSVPPDLEGIRMDNRWGVVFSRYDVSCALEKANSLECQGYVREDAARIGLNVLLYSLQQ